MSTAPQTTDITSESLDSRLGNAPVEKVDYDQHNTVLFRTRLDIVARLDRADLLLKSAHGTIDTSAITKLADKARKALDSADNDLESVALRKAAADVVAAMCNQPGAIELDLDGDDDLADTSPRGAARDAIARHVADAIADAGAEASHLTDEELRDLAEERDRLVWALDRVNSEIYDFNFGLVKSYVKKFTSNTSAYDSEDFTAAAVYGMMTAINSFNPDQGKFGNWAYKQVQRQVLKAVRDADYPNMNHGDFEKRPTILAAKKQLIVESGDESFSPSFEEVAKRAGTTIEQVSRVLDAPRLDSLSVPVGDDGETELGDLIADTSVAVDEHVVRAMSLDALQMFGLPELDGRELYVIVRRFGLDGEASQCLSSIGEQLELSREAVRQIESKALSKLSHPVILRKLQRHGRP